MRRRRGKAVSLGWRRQDCLALTVLLACWGAWLLWAGAARGGGLVDPAAIRAEKVSLVAERIDPNTATAASLRRLPLVGPEKAKAIIEYRRRHGPAGGRAFEFLSDLQSVRGIGPGTVARAGGIVALPRRQIDHPRATINP